MNEDPQAGLFRLFRTIKLVLTLAVIGMAIVFTYLLLTQPKHKVPAADKQVSLSTAQPITKRLPFNDPYYIIGYKTVGTSNDIVVTIHTSSPRYRYYALKQLYTLGFDPTDYVIEYSDFKNPLGN